MKKTQKLALALAAALFLGGCAPEEGGPQATAAAASEATAASGEATAAASEATAASGEATAPPAGSKLDAIPFEDGQLYAAAYLGYRQIDDMDYYTERYLDSAEIPVYFVSDGDFYLVIPRYRGTKLTLSVNDIDTSAPTVLLTVPDAGPFLVQCNASDVFTDATVRLEHGGDAAEFSPFLSLENGAPLLGERGLDLTKPGTAGT